MGRSTNGFAEEFPGLVIDAANTPFRTHGSAADNNLRAWSK